MYRVPHFVDGQTRDTGSVGGPVFDPATGIEQARVDFASPQLVDEVLEVASRVARSWNRASLAERSAVMFRFRELLVSQRATLANIITSEHGKTIDDALGELSRGIENVEFACGLADHLKGEFSSEVARGVDVHSVREPVGVIAAITPFNFPVMVPLWMCANAIASGNSVVLKPSERDPSVSVRLGELLREAGLPNGVFNVVQGDASVVDQLLEDPRIDAVSFVGSTPVARHVYETASRNSKRVQALGGAKNHMVVLADADLDAAADAAINAAFGSAGERCMAISVVVVIDSVADELVRRIGERADRLRVGAGSDPLSDFGPLITREHRDRVAAHLETAKHEGALLVRDGRDLINRAGYFLGPCIIDEVRADMTCYGAEIFGPVLSVVRVSSFEEALRIVNENPYGNGVALFTRDGGTARRFARQVTVGMIGINVSIPVPVSSYSFGGWKDSLFGHSHIYGPEGFNFYTRAKVITTRWPDDSGSGIDLGFPTNR